MFLRHLVSQQLIYMFHSGIVGEKKKKLHRLLLLNLTLVGPKYSDLTYFFALRWQTELYETNPRLKR